MLPDDWPWYLQLLVAYLAVTAVVCIVVICGSRGEERRPLIFWQRAWSSIFLGWPALTYRLCTHEPGDARRQPDAPLHYTRALSQFGGYNRTPAAAAAEPDELDAADADTNTAQSADGARCAHCTFPFGVPHDDGLQFWCPRCRRRVRSRRPPPEVHPLHLAAPQAVFEACERCHVLSLRRRHTVVCRACGAGCAVVLARAPAPLDLASAAPAHGITFGLPAAMCAAAAAQCNPLMVPVVAFQFLARALAIALFYAGWALRVAVLDPLAALLYAALCVALVLDPLCWRAVTDMLVATKDFFGLKRSADARLTLSADGAALVPLGILLLDLASGLLLALLAVVAPVRARLVWRDIAWCASKGRVGHGFACAQHQLARALNVLRGAASQLAFAPLDLFVGLPLMLLGSLPVGVGGPWAVLRSIQEAEKGGLHYLGALGVLAVEVLADLPLALLTAASGAVRDEQDAPAERLVLYESRGDRIRAELARVWAPRSKAAARGLRNVGTALCVLAALLAPWRWVVREQAAVARSLRRRDRARRLRRALAAADRLMDDASDSVRRQSCLRSLLVAARARRLAAKCRALDCEPAARSCELALEVHQRFVADYGTPGAADQPAYRLTRWRRVWGEWRDPESPPEARVPVEVCDDIEDDDTTPTGLTFVQAARLRARLALDDVLLVGGSLLLAATAVRLRAAWRQGGAWRDAVHDQCLELAYDAVALLRLAAAAALLTRLALLAATLKAELPGIVRGGRADLFRDLARDQLREAVGAWSSLLAGLRRAVAEALRGTPVLLVFTAAYFCAGECALYASRAIDTVAGWLAALTLPLVRLLCNPGMTGAGLPDAGPKERWLWRNLPWHERARVVTTAGAVVGAGVFLWLAPAQQIAFGTGAAVAAAVGLNVWRLRREDALRRQARRGAVTYFVSGSLANRVAMLRLVAQAANGVGAVLLLGLPFWDWQTWLADLAGVSFLSRSGGGGWFGEEVALVALKAAVVGLWAVLAWVGDAAAHLRLDGLSRILDSREAAAWRGVAGALLLPSVLKSLVALLACSRDGRLRGDPSVECWAWSSGHLLVSLLAGLAMVLYVPSAVLRSARTAAVGSSGAGLEIEWAPLHGVVSRTVDAFCVSAGVLLWSHRELGCVLIGAANLLLVVLTVSYDRLCPWSGGWRWPAVLSGLWRLYRPGFDAVPEENPACSLKRAAQLRVSASLAAAWVAACGLLALRDPGARGPLLLALGGLLALALLTAVAWALQKRAERVAAARWAQPEQLQAAVAALRAVRLAGLPPAWDRERWLRTLDGVRVAPQLAACGLALVRAPYTYVFEFGPLQALLARSQDLMLEHRVAVVVEALSSVLPSLGGGSVGGVELGGVSLGGVSLGEVAAGDVAGGVAGGVVGAEEDLPVAQAL